MTSSSTNSYSNHSSIPITSSTASNDFPIYKTTVISDETVTITITSCSDTDDTVVSASQPTSSEHQFLTSSSDYLSSSSHSLSASTSDTIYSISTVQSLVSEKLSSTVEYCTGPMEYAVTYTTITVSSSVTAVVTMISCVNSVSEYASTDSQHSTFLLPSGSTFTSILETSSICTNSTSTTKESLLTTKPSSSLISTPESLSYVSSLHSLLIPKESSFISLSESSLFMSTTGSMPVYQTTESSFNSESQVTITTYNSALPEKPAESTYFTKILTTCIECLEDKTKVSEIPIDSTYTSIYQPGNSFAYETETKLSRSLIIPSESNPSQNKELTRNCDLDSCVSTTSTDYTSVRTTTEESENTEQETLISKVHVTSIETTIASETSSDVFIFSITSVTKSTATTDVFPNNANQNNIHVNPHFLFSITFLLFLL